MSTEWQSTNTLVGCHSYVRRDMPVTEKDMESFNARTAALYHANETKGNAGLATAIACGLVYVGDQQRRANLIAELDLLFKLGRDKIMTTEMSERAKQLRAELWPSNEGR